MINRASEVCHDIDCLVVGYYDLDFDRVVKLTRAMGDDNGAYRDLRLAHVELNDRPYRAMDLINYHRLAKCRESDIYHNYDFLWPTVAYLVTFLERRKLRADYINLPHFEWDKFRDKLAGSPRTVVVTTTHIITPEPAEDLIRFIRKHSPASKIVLGGPFVYNQARNLEPNNFQEFLQYFDADYYVISPEGEEILALLVQAVRDGDSLSSIPNIAFQVNRSVRTKPLEQNETLKKRLQDSIESNPGHREELRLRVRNRIMARSAYELTETVVENVNLAKNRIDFDLFPRDEIGDFVSLWTSKSCPFACAFCAFPARSGPYRYLMVDELAEELDQIAALGVSNLTFIDDTFNVPKRRFKNLLRLMIDRDYGFQWNCFYRCDQGDAETVALMREAGCAAVFLGVESGSEEMLRRMNKTASADDYMQAIPMLRDAGILTHANLIVGFPGETDKTVMESIDLIETARPDTFRAQLWYCDPMTPVWQDRDKYGLRGQSFNWQHDTMDVRQAADWVDEMFMRVEGSVWLPQHSFEQWSILYLEKKGVSRSVIFEYIQHFNAIIREGLRGNDRRAINAEHLAIETLVREHFCDSNTVGATEHNP